MKRPISYISILLRFTKGNRENAYQPVGNNLKMKGGGREVGESASTAHGASAVFVSAPGSDGRRNITLSVRPSLGNMSPQGV